MTAKPARRKPRSVLSERGEERVQVEPSLVELAIEQGVPLQADLDRIAGDFWPEDEDPDEFLTTLRRWRQEEG